jgi:hypothetical protein
MLLLAGLGAQQAMAFGCDDGPPVATSLQAGPTATSSRWTETGADGRQLLREAGTLTGAALTLAAYCGRWQAELDLAARHGTRDYAGQSNGGMPVSTTASIEAQQLRLTALRFLEASQAGGAWQAGLRVEVQRTARELASVGAVLGYPETHYQASLAVGLRGHGALPAASSGWQWQSELWLGAGPTGRIELRLPHADAVTLRSGTSRSLEAAMGISHAMASGWEGGFRLSWREQRIAAGAASALWRGGVLVGAALQPEHRLGDAGLQLWLGRRF